MAFAPGFRRLGASCLALLLAPWANAAEPPASRLGDIALAETPEEITVSLIGSRAPDFTSFALERPYRVVVDWAGSTLAGVAPDVSWPRGLVRKISARQFDSEAERISRVTIELATRTSYRLEVDGARVRVRFRKVAVSDIPPTPATPVAAAPPSEVDALRAELLAELPAELPVGPLTEPAVVPSPPVLAEPELPEELSADAVMAELLPARRAGVRAEKDPARLETALAEVAAAERREAEARAEAARREAEAERARAEARRAAEAAEAERRAAVARAEAERVASEARAREAREAVAAAERRAEEARADAARREAEARADAARREAEARAEATRREAESAAVRSAEPVRLARLAPAAPPPALEAATPASAKSSPSSPPPVRLASSRTAEAAAPLTAAPSPASDRHDPGVRVMKYIGFRHKPAEAEVFVRCDGRPRYRVVESPGRVVLELLETRLNVRNNQRALDTSFFPTVVTRVQAVPDGDLTRVVIELREDRVPFRVERVGTTLRLRFDNG